MVSRQSISALVREHFTAIAQSYDEKSAQRKNYLTAIDQLVRAALPATNGQPFFVLDAGCGTGSRAERIFRPIGNAKVYGCDISSAMLKIAAGKHLSGVTQGDFCHLPFRSGSFQVVICLFNAIGYLEDEQARLNTLREFHRVLARDGLLCIDFMNRWHLGEGLRYRRTLQSATWTYLKSLGWSSANRGNLHFALPINGRTVQGFVHGFSRGEVRRLLRAAGFRIKQELVVGYDSGQLKQWFWQGQIYCHARRNDNHKEM